MLHSRKENRSKAVYSEGGNFIITDHQVWMCLLPVSVSFMVTSTWPVFHPFSGIVKLMLQPDQTLNCFSHLLVQYSRSLSLCPLWALSISSNPPIIQLYPRTTFRAEVQGTRVAFERGCDVLYKEVLFVYKCCCRLWWAHGSVSLYSERNTWFFTLSVLVQGLSKFWFNHSR